MMNNKKQWISIVAVGMALATAWAIRGQFGHEQGAAWAGAIGALALVLFAGRKDWYNKMTLVALAAAVGWGMGGMISYGQVVGYGRADNFVNAFYGLGMLFVIGALYGLTGGGLVGLVLDSTKKNKVKWGQLVMEMTAGGLISYYFLVEQLGVLMTPPRSEAWAVCLGVGLAMLWYMARENRNSAIRVAIISALGAGFGFGFGNFLQTVGTILEINFNMWNVMEYSIGFFGGTAMAYAVFSSEWPVEEEAPKKWVNRAGAFLGLAFFPIIVYRESLSLGDFTRRIGEVQNLESVASLSYWFSFLIVLGMIVYVLYNAKNSDYSKKDVMITFFVLLIVYTLISYAITGMFAGKAEFNHHLYVLNIVVLFILGRKGYPVMFESTTEKISGNKWLVYFILIVAVLAVAAIVSVAMNPGIGGSHDRFPIN